MPTDRSPEKEQRWMLWRHRDRTHETGIVTTVTAGPAPDWVDPIEVIPADHPLLLSPDEAQLLGGYEDVMTVAQLEAKNAIRKRLRDYAGEQEEGSDGG